MIISAIRNVSPAIKPANVKNVSINKVKLCCGNDIKTTSFSSMMDESINEFLSASEFNPVAKVKFHKLLDKALPEIMKPENYLNKGRKSKVYRISDSYVAKIKRGHNDSNAISFINIARTPDKRFNSLGFYFGEPVIRVGNVEILKNATPHDYVKCGIDWFASGVNRQKAIDDYKNKYLPICSSLPQESFDEFAQGLKSLNGISNRQPNLRKVYYTPDIINPNNILIANNHIRLVDKLNKTHISEPNNLFTMLQPMLLRLTPEDYIHNRPELTDARTAIIRKSFVAAEKADLPLKENSLIDPYTDYYIGIATDRDFFKALKMIKCARREHVPKNERIDFINKVFET